jgi:SAM-dependent methyltransferase
MRTASVHHALTRLIADGLLAPAHSMLVIGGGPAEAALLRELGFTDVALLNINPDMGVDVGPYRFVTGDAHALDHPDGAFDAVLTSDCLHHCRAPHRVLTEMYRVARRTVIVVESRDNLVMRLAVRLGLSASYELQPKNLTGEGGVDFSAVPNFIYRWREGEFEKTIRSYDPTIEPRFRYFYDLNLPEARLRGGSMKARLARAAGPLVRLVARLVPRQGNTFTMVVHKDPAACSVQPWLRREGAAVVPDRAYYARRFRVLPEEPTAAVAPAGDRISSA